VRIRTENAADAAAVRAVVSAAFASAEHAAPPLDDTGDPGEAVLVEWLRADPGWIPDLALVALVDDRVVGHAVCTRGHVGDVPVLGLGPVSVAPDLQGQGIGAALMRALIDGARARSESLIGLLGEPGYYARFGFRPATELGVLAPDPAWGDYFQALALTGSAPRGAFTYAEPFARL